MIRPMISSLVNPYAGGDNAITRYLAQLDIVLNSHYTYATALEFQAGDTFEFEHTGSFTTAREYFFRSTGSDFLVVWSDLTWYFAGCTVTVDGVPVVSLTTSAYSDNKLHKIKVTFTSSMSLTVLGARLDSLGSGVPGIITNPVATIGGVTTTNTLSLPTGNSEPSTEGNNTITYVNIPNSNRELYQLSVDETQWGNISPSPQELPSVIEIA
tara:strand:- start:404 stop:1039 length:636 start_codon:yes stop_codon:yes gene_type:complete